MPPGRKWVFKRLDVTTQYIDAHGEKHCSGGKALKSTQTYPDGFGKALVNAFRDQYTAATREPYATVSSLCDMAALPTIDWQDADLEDVQAGMSS